MRIKNKRNIIPTVYDKLQLNAMQIREEKNNAERYHVYTICNDNNRFRSSSKNQKTDLFRKYERLESPDGKISQDYEHKILKTYRLYNYALNVGRMAVQNNIVGIASRNRYKHFQKPAISKIQTTDSPCYSEHNILSGILCSARRQCYTVSSKLESCKNAETQTDYRDSEVQTEPWEPPYKIIPGHNPEILTLTHLTWESGLPADTHEIHIINRMRMKKAWETILPPMDTPTNIRMRSSILTALEIDDWAFRESEIQYIMDLRLKLMRNLLERRESECKKKVQNRFGRLQDKLGKRRNDRIKSIRSNLERDLRKLRKQHRDKQQPCKSDIIERHSNPKSDLYAPLMRLGEHPARRHEILQRSFLSDSYVEQEEEEEEEEEDKILSWLPALEKAKVTKCRSKPADFCIRETRWTDEKLKQLHADLKAIRLNVKSVDTIPGLMKRTYKQPTLPVTPRRPGVWNSTRKQREESATFIQKTVRGRAIQRLMHEGSDRCRELIEELQSIQALEQQGQQEHQDERIRMVELQRLQNDRSMQEDRLCEILNSLEGKTVCGTLDLLNKELVRLEDERRAHAFALLAERERNMREAAEAGKRQLERNRRREFDEMFKQVVKVNQDSVEAYLEDIIGESVDWISDKTAKEHVLELCDKMDAISKHILENANSLAEKELVTDMIYNFVLPEVEKQNMRRKIHDQQQSYIRNAHISIYEKISDLPVESLQFVDKEICIKKHEDVQTISTSDTDIGVESLIYQTDSREKSTDVVHSLLNSIIASM